MKYKILFVDTGIKIGGGQRSLLLLLEKINKRIFKPILACPVGGFLIKEARNQGIQVKELRLQNPAHTRKKRGYQYNIASCFSIFIDSIPVIMDLVRIINKENVSLVYANNFEPSIIAGIAARLARVPIVFHKRYVVSRGTVERLSNMLCNKVISVSKAAQWHFARNSKSKLRKYTVIYNGVDLNKYRLDIDAREIKTEFHIQENENIVGTVGRLSPEKGYDFFLQAARKVVDVLPDTKFIIVGGTYFDDDELYQVKLKELIHDLGLTEHVIFTGFRNDIPNLIAGMDVFVLSSTIPDAFPRTPLEAMAMGKPVVATNVGGIPEAVEGNITGFLVPSENDESLANAILTLLQDRALAKQMGMSGRKRVEQLFTIEKNIQETERVLIEVINGSRT